MYDLKTRKMLLAEHRPSIMEWLYLKPKNLLTVSDPKEAADVGLRLRLRGQEGPAALAAPPIVPHHLAVHDVRGIVHNESMAPGTQDHVLPLLAVEPYGQ